jgi:acetolactate synthase-1/2/3 large subunit
MSDTARTGADALVSTLAAHGVTACFANPGTSEMHLVQALDREPRIRSVLCLFEGVATGAADGFARLAGTPAMTLLHLGPGYANGAANIHNARRARTPMINVVGDHATFHRDLDAPLTSDVETLVAPNSRWVGVVERSADAGPLAAQAFAATHGPAPAPVSLILPADAAWNPGGADGAATPAPPAAVSASRVAAVAAAVKRAAKPVLLVNGPALATEAGLVALARIAGAGVRIITDTFVGRILRGAGLFAPEKLAYFGEQALAQLDGVDLLVTAGTEPPVAFFAYPGRPSRLTPDGCATLSLAHPDEDSAAALCALAETLGAAPAPGAPARVPDAPAGELFPASLAAGIARHLPEGAIISDDAVTAGLPIWMATHGAPRHDWLCLTGGAIGQGLPLAVGAAVACPDRKVIALTGDGAGAYTPQALWTMARERLPIVTVVFANRSYRILTIEMARTEAGNPGPAAKAMLSLDDPAMDWVKLAEGFGVEAVRVDTAEAFESAFARAVAMDVPVLIEAVL